MRIKNVGPLLIVLFITGFCGAWVFAGHQIPVFQDIWRAIGRPGMGGRALALMGFCFGVFYLAAKVLKSGPI